jgi:hypothetical protein
MVNAPCVCHFIFTVPGNDLPQSSLREGLKVSYLAVQTCQESL